MNVIMDPMAMIVKQSGLTEEGNSALPWSPVVEDVVRVGSPVLRARRSLATVLENAARRLQPAEPQRTARPAVPGC